MNLDSKDKAIFFVDPINLSRNELKSRLHEMEISYDPTLKKTQYMDLYNNAIKNPQCRSRIIERLLRDTETNNENRKKRLRDTSEDASRDLCVPGKQGKIQNSNGDYKNTAQILQLMKDFGKNNSNSEERKNLMTPIKFEELIPKKDTETKNNIQVQNPDLKIFNHSEKREAGMGIVKKGVVTTQRINIAGLSDDSKNFKNNTIDNTESKYKSPINDELKVKNNEKIDNLGSNHVHKVKLNYIESNNFFQNNPKQIIIESESEEVKNQCVINSSSQNKLNNEQKFLNYNSAKNTITDKDSRNTNFKIVNKNSDFNIRNEIKFSPKINSNTNLNLNSQTSLIRKNPDTTTIKPQNFLNTPNTNEIFRKELEQAKIISSANSSKRSLVKINSNQQIKKLEKFSINGAVQEIKIRSPKLVSETKNENGLNKWDDFTQSIPQSPSRIPIKLLVKYFIAGIVCSVVFYGLVYCIQNCPPINVDLFLKKKGILNENHAVGNEISINKDTAFKEIEANSANVSTDIPTMQKTSYPEMIKEFFAPLSNISHALINPKEFLWNLFVGNLKYLAVDVAWTFFTKNIWYILALFVLKLIAYKAYRSYMNNKLADNVYKSVKSRLRNIYDNKKLLEGVTEDEIIREYSKDCGMSEDYFRKNLLPKLKNSRKADGEVREFETLVSGRNRTAWQYVGY